MDLFNPKYKITSKLLTNIKRISVLVADLNRKHFTKIVLLQLEKRAREVSAHSSTSIEGNPLPLTEVKKILKNIPSHIRDTEREVLNYNQALVHLNNLCKNSIAPSLDLKLILKIQKMVTLGLIQKSRSGKIRNEPVFVNNPITRKPIYLPPDHKDVKQLLDSLFTYIKKNKTEIDPLVIAGIFHKQFVIIHPFIDGNGRSARLATKILLAGLGLNTFNLFSFENYYNQNITKYFKNVGLIGNYYDLEKKVDFTEWLEYFTDGIIDELLRVGKELSKAELMPANHLEGYHKKIIDYIKKNGFITDRDYAKLTNRARPTRNLDFRKLSRLGIIEIKGKARGAYYILKSE